MARPNRRPLRILRRILLRIAARIPLLLPLWRALRDRFSPHHRTLRQIAAHQPDLLLQPSNLSRQDRYPGIFAALARQLEGLAEPRIVSFGCATGDEVFTLHKLFPAARITGIDINPRNIAAAQKRLARMGASEGIRFVCAGSADGEPDDGFDAVLALAVLRHGDLQAQLPDSCAAILPFDQVERAVAGLVRCVRPGGYLAIWNCHFRLCDMASAAIFETVWSDPRGAQANSPLYGPDNRRLAEPGYADALFRKIDPASDRQARAAPRPNA
jgi:SAM-dependent methyltransferase